MKVLRPVGPGEMKQTKNGKDNGQNHYLPEEEQPGPSYASSGPAPQEESEQKLPAKDLETFQIIATCTKKSKRKLVRENILIPLVIVVDRSEENDFPKQQNPSADRDKDEGVLDSIPGCSKLSQSRTQEQHCFESLVRGEEELPTTPQVPTDPLFSSSRNGSQTIVKDVKEESQTEPMFISGNRFETKRTRESRVSGRVYFSSEPALEYSGNGEEASEVSETLPQSSSASSLTNVESNGIYKRDEDRRLSYWGSDDYRRSIGYSSLDLSFEISDPVGLAEINNRVKDFHWICSPTVSDHSFHSNSSSEESILQDEESSDDDEENDFVDKTWLKERQKAKPELKELEKKTVTFNDEIYIIQNSRKRAAKCTSKKKKK